MNIQFSCNRSYTHGGPEERSTKEAMLIFLAFSDAKVEKLECYESKLSVMWYNFAFLSHDHQ